MSSIVTFYSYKGGVGRSMALANIAFELARRNKKVLIVDWDLEAPGLERYFSKFKIDRNSDGLLQLLIELRSNKQVDYRSYLWTIFTDFSNPIYLLHSGREKSPTKYSADLEAFNWEDFFKLKGGGKHLEDLRNHWLNDFDLILIDSRTGLSDASGVCTILLPDIMIPMFTANFQSLFGIRDIVSLIQSARQRLSVDRMALTILPVPSRFGTRVEFKESQEWLDRIANILKDCFSDWLPKWIEPRYVLEQIKIPQVDFFSFGEKLAVVEQGTNDPEGMGFIYAKLAEFLASDFTAIETFVGSGYYNDRKAAYEKQNELFQALGVQEDKDKHKYDLFISYPRSAYQWVQEVLLPALTEYLDDELGYSPKIFVDINEISAGSNWSDALKVALERSKVFLFVLTDKETQSQFVSTELLFAESIQRTTATNIIFPVLFGEVKNLANLPHSIQARQITDLSEFSMEAINASTKVNARFGSLIEKFSESIAISIRKVNEPDQSLIIQENRIELEFESLAEAYENVRNQMPPGDNRTRAMQDIVDKMKAKASAGVSLLEGLMTSASAGRRLAAIAILQEQPKIEYTEWLAEHVGEVEKPFIGYQAAVSLYNASRVFSKDYTYQLLRVVNTALGNINKFNYKDPNQIKILESAKAELSYTNLSRSTAKPLVELGYASYKTYKWYTTGADRCMGVARIGRDSSIGVGTGFLLKGRDLKEELENELILMTTAHVVSSDSADGYLRPDEAVIIFEALDSKEEFRGLEIIWSSPSIKLGITILRFANADQQRLSILTKHMKFYPIAKHLPQIDTANPQRIYVVGHPMGGTLQLSFEDSILLDHQSPKIHYRTSTSGGSAGSPVFNQQWDLIGIHSARNDAMPRLHNQGGTYSAQEGIWIQAIIDAFKSSNDK